MRITLRYAALVGEVNMDNQPVGESKVFIPGDYYEASKDADDYVINHEGHLYRVKGWLVVEEGDGQQVDVMLNPENDNGRKIAENVYDRPSLVDSYRRTVKTIYGIDMREMAKADYNPKMFNGKW